MHLWWHAMYDTKCYCNVFETKGKIFCMNENDRFLASDIMIWWHISGSKKSNLPIQLLSASRKRQISCGTANTLEFSIIMMVRKVLVVIVNWWYGISIYMFYIAMNSWKHLGIQHFEYDRNGVGHDDYERWYECCWYSQDGNLLKTTGSVGTGAPWAWVKITNANSNRNKKSSPVPRSGLGSSCRCKVPSNKLHQSWNRKLFAFIEFWFHLISRRISSYLVHPSDWSC